MVAVLLIGRTRKTNQRKEKHEAVKLFRKLLQESATVRGDSKETESSR